jgi:hypothetical protein
MKDGQKGCHTLVRSSSLAFEAAVSVQLDVTVH